MKKIALSIILIFAVSISACSGKVTTIINNTTVIPSVNSSTVDLSAYQQLPQANAEVALVLTAAGAYCADNQGVWPSNSTKLYPDFITAPTDAVYAFSTSTGKITSVINGDGFTKGLTFDIVNQMWK